MTVTAHTGSNERLLTPAGPPEEPAAPLAG